MSLSRVAISFAFVVASLPAGMPAQAAAPPATAGTSPALGGAGGVREPGIHGDVLAGETPNYNCGVRLVGQLPLVGNVQGVGKCAYVRTRGGEVHVIDVSNPA